MKKSPHIYIVLPVHNALNSTKRFLNYILNQTYTEYSVIICDDGSTDGTFEYVRRNYSWVILIKGNGDLWWTKGINKCIKYVLAEADDDDFILTINNDVLLDGRYLQQKIERSQQYPSCIIGSLCVFLSNPKKIETSGLVMDWKKCRSYALTRFGEIRKSQHKGIIEATHLPAKGVLIPIKVYREIGIYDEINFPQYHADTDFTLRAHKAGYRVLVDFDSIVYSEVKFDNMGIKYGKFSIMRFIATFKGHHSINSIRVIYNYDKKHFATRRCVYFMKRYFYVFGGFLRRYFVGLNR